MDYRKLEADEYIAAYDEYWTDDGEWKCINTSVLMIALCGKRVGGRIMRREVVLMNRNPTTEELAACLYPYRSSLSPTPLHQAIPKVDEP